MNSKSNPVPQTQTNFVRAGSLAQLPEGKSMTANLDGHVIAIFHTAEGIFAVDNRCPHMGFPLDRGTVKDCILTCHWHHARFDLHSGGAFDQWADDVRAFPVKVADGDIFVNVAQHGDLRRHRIERLRDGIERNIPLVIGKSVIALLDDNGDGRESFRIGLEFGVRNRRDGWGAGLTTLTCMMNLLDSLRPDDRARAMFHGLAAVANDSDGHPPRFTIRPLPGSGASVAEIKRWLRRFVEVRDTEGAERCIVSAVRMGASPNNVADMMFGAATDHRYLDGGHTLDFTNKALEALDHAGWDLAEPVLASLARGYATGDRMEEANSWRNPIDLIAILEPAFDAIPGALEAGRRVKMRWSDRDTLVQTILGDDPSAIVDAMLAALRGGCASSDLAAAVAYAAALRVARFPTSNEYGDWDTAHHSFTFANAVHQAVRRVSSIELVRGIFDAAMTVYLDRFLNVPAAKLPERNGARTNPAERLAQLPDLLDRQQQVNQAGELVADYLGAGGDPKELLAALGNALLREDRDFHTIQDIEAAFRQYSILEGTDAAAHVLIATTRYLAAHAPTARAQAQTYRIAFRLNRGEQVFNEP
ncbi:MAG TPA: Rieske 2Fe-2S domain-containing protein [Candidatus Dormibacteraeota bacterium]|nr:Rieske 2Fe-2S domain-containing protein [Candidatus Dormibacteraeota bacterium]